MYETWLFCIVSAIPPPLKKGLGRACVCGMVHKDEIPLSLDSVQGFVL